MTLPETTSTGESSVGNKVHLLHLHLWAVLAHKASSNLCGMAAAGSTQNSCERSLAFGCSVIILVALQYKGLIEA